MVLDKQALQPGLKPGVTVSHQELPFIEHLLCASYHAVCSIKILIYPSYTMQQGW